MFKCFSMAMRNPVSDRSVVVKVWTFSTDSEANRLGSAIIMVGYD